MERNCYIDALKGFAITLVIWGHSMQLMGVIPYPMDNHLWKAIYMFHMPLFFFLSGFVSVNAIARNFKELFKGRCRTLLLPLCIWSVVLYLIRLGIGMKTISTESVKSIIASTVFGVIYGYWFVWVLLYSIFTANIMYRLNRHKTAILILSVLLVWLVPENIIPYFNHFKHMYPFFISGYVFAVNRDKFKFVNKKYTTFIALTVFIVCLIIYRRGYLIFIPQKYLDVWNEHANYLWLFKHYLYLFVAAFSGIYMSYRLIKRIPTSSKFFNLLKDMGKYTLIMYLLQGLFYFTICENYDLGIKYNSLAFVIGMTFTYICYRAGKWLASNKKTAFLAGK